MTNPALAADWQWTTPTPGAANIAATTAPVTQETVTNEVPITAMTLVISEVFAKGGDTAAEFVELYNYGTVAVDASGLKLTNHAGKSYVIEEGSILESKGYKVLKGVLAITDGGDTVTLSRGSEEIDRLEFDGKTLKDGQSAGRYCDVYELRFCDVQPSSPTPGMANTLEDLKVWAEPADGSLRPGQKVVFLTNKDGAKIFLSPLPDTGDLSETKEYTGPFTINERATYWYYAQYQGQATVPQKIVFTVNSRAPSQQQLLGAKGVLLNEVMVDGAAKKGWIEIYNGGSETVDLAALRIDTRAKATTDCSTCLMFSGTNKIFPSAYALLELPKATVNQLIARQTPVEVRLLFDTEVLSTMTIPLQSQSDPWMSWIPQDTSAGWTDVPTPGAKNISMLFAEGASEKLSPEQLGHAIYVQGGYEDDRLILRGKAIPGHTLTVFGESKALADVKVPANGQWQMSLIYEATKKITHLFFRLTTPNGETGLLSEPFPVPAFDAADPRQNTPKKVMNKAQAPTKVAASLVKNVQQSGAKNTGAFDTVPLLSSMTGTVLTPSRRGYATQSPVLAFMPEAPDVQNPILAFFGQAAGALVTMLFALPK